MARRPGKTRGRPADETRRARVAKLRTSGLTFTAIGRRLGISRQAAHSLLIRSKKQVQLPGFHCRECRMEICPWNPTWRGGFRRNQTVYCLACLAKHPQASIGQRILAYRVNAGMTQADLGRLTGINKNTLGVCERGGSDPHWNMLATLARYFGVALLGIPAGAGARAVRSD